jgi:hypothetical protein
VTIAHGQTSTGVNLPIRVDALGRLDLSGSSPTFTTVTAGTFQAASGNHVLGASGLGTTSGTLKLYVANGPTHSLILNVAASSANWFEITAGATGVGPTLAAAGETNVDLLLNAKGTGNVNLANNVATPANGSTTARVRLGATAGFGIYYGSSNPTVSAAQGSLYLRSDGSSGSTRAYINTDGGTSWTAITTAT